jgi:hypothetical protein
VAISCPADLNTGVLRSEISGIYGRVASEPNREFHFHGGPSYGVDMTDTMIERARLTAADADMRQVEIRKSDATSLPVDHGSVDVIISNGVLNLGVHGVNVFARKPLSGLAEVH